MVDNDDTAILKNVIIEKRIIKTKRTVEQFDD